MAEMENFSEINDNFDTIKTLLNSIRAQGILNTSDVDKMLNGINSKLEKINTEEDIDLIKAFLTDLKQKLDERHNVVVSKFGAIESLFSNLLKNSADALKSSEVKELFDIVATNLSVFSREIVSQKDTLTDITLRLDAMRSDDTQKKDIIKNITVLKGDLERLNNGFDSMILSLNENFKAVIKTISGIDYSEEMTRVSNEISDVVTSAKTILSAIQLVDKKNDKIEGLISELATKDDIASAKKSMAEVASQSKILTDSLDTVVEKSYKIDNLAEKIDASVNIIAGLKSVIQDTDEKSFEALLEKLNQLEAVIREVTSNDDFEKFKASLESLLKAILEGSNSLGNSFDSVNDEIKRLNIKIQALDIDLGFSKISAELTNTADSIKSTVVSESGKVANLIDANITRTLNDITSNTESLTSILSTTQKSIAELCEKNFSDVATDIAGLKTIVSQLDENNVSANNAIFSNLTDRLAIFENSLKNSLEKQEDYVSSSSDQVVAKVSEISNLSATLDYKLDSSLIEIGNSKREFELLKSSVDNLLNLDFVNVVKNFKVDLYAVKKDLESTFDNSSSDLTDKFAADLFAKYELLISKLDSVQDGLVKKQNDALNEMLAVLGSISASIMDVISYVSESKNNKNLDFEEKIDNLSKDFKDNTLNYVESVRDIVNNLKTQLETNLNDLETSRNEKFQSVHFAIDKNTENIREDIKTSYNKLQEIQDNFRLLNNTVDSNQEVLEANVRNLFKSADDIKEDFSTKINLLKTSLIEKVSEFKQEFACDYADNISEIKFNSESLHSKALQNSIDLKNELRNEIAEIIETLKKNIGVLTEHVASSTIKIEGFNKEVVNIVKDDFSNDLDNVISKIKSSLADSVAGIDNKISDAVIEFAATAEAVKSELSNSVDTIDSRISDVAGDFNLSTDSMKEYVSDILHEVNLKIVNIYDEFSKTAADLNSALKDYSEKLEARVNHVAESTYASNIAEKDAVMQAIAGISDELNQKVAIFSDSVENLKANLLEVVNGTDIKIGSIISTIDNKMDAVVDVSTNSTNRIESNIISAVKDIDDKIFDAVDEFSNSIDTLKAGVYGAMDGVSERVNDVINKFDASLDSIKKDFDSSITSINNDVNHVSDQLSGLHSSFNELSDITSASISSSLDKMLKSLFSVKEDVSLNSDKSINAVKAGVDELRTDFNSLVEKFNCTENIVDEDLARQISIIEDNFNAFNNLVSDLLKENLSTVSEKIDEGFIKVTDKISEQVNSGLDEYKSAVENVLSSIKDENLLHSEHLNGNLTELSNLLADRLSVQNDYVQSQLDRISDSLKSVIDVESENSSENFKSLKNNLLEMESDIKANNQDLINELKYAVEHLFDDKSVEMQKNTDTVRTLIDDLSSNMQTITGSLRELNSIQEEKDDVLTDKISTLTEEVLAVKTQSSDRMLNVHDSISNVIIPELSNLNGRLENLFEQSSVDFIAQLRNSNNDILDKLKSSADDLRNEIEQIKQQIDKSDLEKIDALEVRFNTLEEIFRNKITEVSDATKSEISIVTASLINANKNMIDEFEKILDLRIKNLSDNNTTSMPILADIVDKITNELLETRSTVAQLKEIVENIKQQNANANNGAFIESQDITDELNSQFSKIAPGKHEIFDSLVSSFENIVYDTVNDSVNSIKDYLDIKSESYTLDSKIDELKENLAKISEDVMSNISKLLEANIFDGTISEIKATNEILLTSMSEKLNNEISEFLKENISTKIDEKFNLFDKKFIETVIDKYEEIKLLTGQFNDKFEKMSASVDELTSAFNYSVGDIQKSIDDLSFDFNELKEQIQEKLFDSDYKDGLNNRIQGIQALVDEQLGYIHNITDLCEANLPELQELSAVIKNDIQLLISDLESKVDNQDLNFVQELDKFKADVITQLVKIFNQISFVTEEEEILDFIQEKHSDLITILSHIVTSTDDIDDIKDNVETIDNKVDLIKNDLDIINKRVNSIISSEGNIDYVYSLQDLETDIANLRIVLNDMKNDSKSKEIEDLILSVNDVHSLLETVRTELPSFEAEEFKREFQDLAEDIVSISARTNKLILASDESSKELKENLQDFKLIINDLDERTRNFAQESGLDLIDKKLGSLNNLVQSGAKNNQVFNQVFEYLAEWVDKAGEQISVIADKVDALDEIDRIKMMIEDWHAENKEDSANNELVEVLGEIFDKQAKRISSLETKLDRVIVETSIENDKSSNNSIEELLTGFISAIDDKFTSQQNRIQSLESKLEEIMSHVDNKDTAQLTKKVGGMDRQIAKLNKSIEKIASHVVEK